MRVTAQVQAATRQRILEVAQGLFATQGLETQSFSAKFTYLGILNLN